jgi:hypothetical protein
MAPGSAHPDEEPMPDSILKYVSEFRDPIIAILVAGCAVLFVVLLLSLSRIGKLNRQYARLTRNTSGGNLEDVLHSYMDSVNGVVDQINSLEGRADQLESNQLHCLQRVGVVRFDAFEEVGGEQSFAVVIIDKERNGVALSSVYSRSDVRVYAKAIKDGTAVHKLTEEEKQALAQADGK